MSGGLRLDGNDRAVLFLLQENARANAAEIAALTGLAVWDVARRIGRFEAEGLVTGTTVTVDAAKAGYPLEALFRVRLADDKRATADTFGDAARLAVEVLDCWRIDPPGAYLLRGVARDEADMVRLRMEVIERLAPVIAVAVTPLVERVKAGGKIGV